MRRRGRSIRFRAWALLVSGLLSVLGGASVALFQAYQVGRAQARLQVAGAIQVDNLLLLSGMVNEQSAVRGYLSYVQPQFLQPFYSGQAQVHQAERAIAADSAGAVGGEFEQPLALAERYAAAWTSRAASDVSAVQFRKAPEIDPVPALDRKHMFDSFRREDQVIARLSAANVATARAALASHQRVQLIAIAIASGVASVAMLVLILLISRSVLRPILALAGAARELAAGLDPPIPHVASGDEVGDLARALVSWEGAVEARRRTEGRFRIIYEQAPLGICRLDTHGAVVDANPLFERLLGYGPGRLAGTAFVDLIVDEPGGESSGAETAMVKDLVAGRREAVALEARCRHRSGASVWTELVISAVRDDSGRPAHYVVLMEDVSARVEAREAQRQAFRELERVSKDKSYFVSVVSHEFRNALTTIQGFGEVLRDERFEPEQVTEFAGDIFNEAQRLTRMIGELLDLERMESGRMTLTVGEFDLNEAVREVAGGFRRAAPAHTLALELDAAVGTVEADSDKITQVLQNLVSNAIKYSPAGGAVTVRSRASGHRVEVSVSDQGVGIPAEALDKVFERYTRLEDAGSRHIRGTGLGLPIVRQIAELHGGRAWVESEVGRGSTFHVEIPARRPREA
ncbi:MAG: ATP-binding protein [Candidatus Dormibacterales bacterium]